MEAILEKIMVKKKVKINSLTPNFSYINHLGVKVKNIKTVNL